MTTALLLSRDSKDHKNNVTIVAKHMPGDYDIEYASPWAGANYMPSVLNLFRRCSSHFPHSRFCLYLSSVTNLEYLFVGQKLPNGIEILGSNWIIWPRISQRREYISRVNIIQRVRTCNEIFLRGLKLR